MQKIVKSDPVKLLEKIDGQLNKVHTTSLDLSFNEILDMNRDGELNISPDYQRVFQWSEGARSRFIESLLLEMPVPPIFLIEDQDGKYLLIDGLQRISSYLHTRGALDADHLDPPVKFGDKLVFTDCDIVTDLNGLTYDDLGTALQIKLKRAFIRAEIIRKGSDARFRYHMFKRLNTGGELLSEQQIRNCTIRLLDDKFIDFIKILSAEEVFLSCVPNITNDRRLSGYHEELVLRFFAFKNWRSKFKHDVGDFLTDYMEAVSDPEIKESFDFTSERECFLKTFAVLAKALGEEAFAFARPARDRVIKGFSANQYEAVTQGIQAYLSRLDPSSASQMARISKAISGLKLNKDYYKLTTGGGKNSPGPLRARIEAVQKVVEAAV